MWLANVVSIFSLHVTVKCCLSSHWMWLAKVVQLLTACDWQMLLIISLHVTDWQKLSTFSRHVTDWQKLVHLLTACDRQKLVYFLTACDWQKLPIFSLWAPKDFYLLTAWDWQKNRCTPSHCVWLVKTCSFSHCMWLAKGVHSLTACDWQQFAAVWVKARIPWRCTGCFRYLTTAAFHTDLVCRPHLRPWWSSADRRKQHWQRHFGMFDVSE